MHRWGSIGVFLMVLLSGCTGGGDAPIGGQGGTDGDPAGQADNGAGDGEQALAPDPPEQWTVGIDGSMFEGGPTASTPEEYSFNSFHHAVAGTDDLEIFFGATEPVTRDLLIHQAEFTAFLRHDSIGVSSSPALGLDGSMGLGAGSTDSNGDIVFMNGPDTMVQGDIHQFSARVPVPTGGLVVANGSAFSFGTASFYAQADEAGSAVLLLNHEGAHTRFDLDSEWIELPVEGNETSLLSERGTFEAGGGCGSDGDDAGILDFDVDVPEDAVSLTIVADAAGADVDIVASGPSGRGAASYPGSPETLKLFAPNLDAIGRGAWVIEILNCTDEGLSFDLDITARLVP